MKKISITTLGCKVNQYESASFASSFEEAGCHVVDEGEQPDIVVINTCTVTGKAGAQSRQLIRRAARENPEAKIVITGCHAQLDAQNLIEMKELEKQPVCIVGNGNKHLLVSTALQKEPLDLAMVMTRISSKKEICELPVSHFPGRTRAYLKVQDGCDSYCTYCIVPFTRGHSRSLSIDSVIWQAREFERQGYREIVVTGIHVGLYGKDLDEGYDIVRLMKTLCETTQGIRYRLSSIEPNEISDRLIDHIVNLDNFMPHLHIPLQSGSDDILERMNRRYSTTEFKEKIDMYRERLPESAIGIDVLVGFPGETDKQFESSRSFLEKLDCTYLHVFPYSKRPGTIAAGFDNQVEKAIKTRRVASLKQLDKKKKKRFYSRMIGSTRDVLVEAKRDSHGLLKGFSDNYIPLHFQGDDQLINRVVQVEITGLDGLNVLGKCAGGDA